MAIAKRPQSNQADIDAFISGAPPATPVKAPAPAAKDDKRTPCVIRFPPDMLAKIDAAAKTRGLSRAGWITMVAGKALEEGNW
jgi:hypothetical protein